MGNNNLDKVYKFFFKKYLNKFDKRILYVVKCKIQNIKDISFLPSFDRLEIYILQGGKMNRVHSVLIHKLLLSNKLKNHSFISFKLVLA